MSDLIVIGFSGEFKADEVLLDLEDAAIVVRNKDGKIRLRQTQDLVTAGAVSGGFWGLLIGLIFLEPLLAIFGSAVGALSGALTDIGIDDNFIRELGNTIEPETSAIFVLVRKSTPDKVLEDLSKFEGKVLQTSLSHEDEAKLQAALTKSEMAKV